MDEIVVVTADGRSVTVYDAGDRGGVPVIFHHGTPSSGQPSESLVEVAREQSVRLISFDRPGYAASTRRPGRRIVDVAEDVAAISDRVGIDRFATWGLSGGGPHALATAARLGDRVSAVASVSGVVPPDTESVDFVAGMGEANVHEFGAAQAGEETLRPLLEAEAEGIRQATVPDLVAAMRSILSDADVEAVETELGEYVVATFKRAVANGVDGWLDDDLAFVAPWAFDVAEIDVPALVVQGRQDLMVPYAHGEWLAAHIPGAEARFSEDEGHITQLLPDAVRRLHAWLLERSDV